MLVAVLGVVLPLGAATIEPAPARADATYTIPVCNPANGNVNHALVFSSSRQTIVEAQNCNGSSKGQGLQAWPTAATPGGQGGGWWFTAPPGTTITRIQETGNYFASGGWIVQWSAGYRNLFRIGGLGECPLGQPCAALFTPSGPQWST
ncbi:MAG: hypothetical protein ABSG43_28470, partial [Solirubrobacteraceae bacterium]